MKKIIQLVVITFVMSTSLFALTWEQMFPEINSYQVTEIKQGSVSNVGNYGYVFGLNDSLLAYYNYSSQLEIFTHWNPFLAIVSFCFADTVSDEIYCALDHRGSASRSDGLYVFNTTSETYTINFYEVFPRLVKKLSTGFYFCCEYNTYFSENGSTWEEIDEFYGIAINDVQRTSSGKIFYGGEGTLYMQTPDSISSYTTGFPDVNDIYVRGTPNNNEVLITLGTGSGSDGLYKVLYNDSTITGFELIVYISEANLITEYTDSYIVTCKNSADVYTVPFDTGGAAWLRDHGMDISNIYCISDQYPIFTPNFLIGTDKGVFMCTGDTSIDNEQFTVDNYELQQNYPNPFNNETVIPYELKADSDVKINIYNAKGEIIRAVSLGNMRKGVHEYKLSTDNFSAGQYFYSLSINGEVTGAKKMLYLR